MKDNILKNKALFLIITILVVIFFSLFVLTLYTHFKTLKVEKKPVEKVKDIIVDSGLMLNKTEYYIALNDIVTLDINNPKNVDYKLHIENTDIISNVDGSLKGIAIGKTGFTIEIKKFKAFNGTIYVVNGLRLKDEKFDKSKRFLSCNEFSEDENDILDNALKDRVNKAKEQTRASVVEVARFITLEFDRRIPYFYENGRLNNYASIHKVDGEGRYYHKGLYLNKSRYKSISKRFTGPGAWGCKITQYQDEPGYGFKPRTKMPNGFDCSGFISWVLYNGGFDVGDVGAGDVSIRDDDLYICFNNNCIFNVHIN